MLYKRIKEQNNAAYLTLMSIIQGVALSFFTFAIVNNYQGLTFAAWVLVSCTFMVIILTWFEYIIGISIFFWAHGILDSIIPFVLFSGEILLIETMASSSSAWFFSMGVFCVFTLVAFLNMYHKASQESDNNGLFECLGKWKKFTITSIAVYAVLFLLFGRYWSANIALAFFLSSFVLVAAFGGQAMLYWSRVLRYAREMHNKQLQATQKQRA